MSDVTANEPPVDVGSIRDTSGRFKPGHSGNPKGRPPKDRRLRELLLERLGHEALNELAAKLADAIRRVEAKDLVDRIPRVSRVLIETRDSYG